MFKTILIGTIIIACASIAAAQSDYKKFEFFGGFSHNRVDTGIGDEDPSLRDIINEREGFNGFEVSATGNITRYIGLKADFSGHFKSKNDSVSRCSGRERFNRFAPLQLSWRRADQRQL